METKKKATIIKLVKVMEKVFPILLILNVLMFLFAENYLAAIWCAMTLFYFSIGLRYKNIAEDSVKLNEELLGVLTKQDREITKLKTKI